MNQFFNQFDVRSFTRVAQQPIMIEPDISFTIDTTPICEFEGNKVRQLSNIDGETRSYRVSKEEKSTAQRDIVEKLTELVKPKPEITEAPTQRYFTRNIDLIPGQGRCRRCHESGHFERQCTQKIPVKCFFCLGPHDYCPPSCFKCSQVGHIAKECNIKGIRCHKCDQKGHKANDCNKIDFKLSIIQKGIKYSKLEILCLNCHKAGHVNCNSLVKDNLYGQSYLALISQKDQKKQANRNLKMQVANVRSKKKIKDDKRMARIRALFEEEESILSTWSNESPDQKRKFNNKKRKNKKRNQKK